MELTPEEKAKREQEQERFNKVARAVIYIALGLFAIHLISNRVPHQDIYCSSYEECAEQAYYDQADRARSEAFEEHIRGY